MRVLVVSGIWPPDVGGPASHAPDVAAYLLDRGVDVEVVTTADRTPAPARYPVRFTSRRLPVGIRHLHSLALVGWRARTVDVVYSTGMFGRSSLAAALTRRPYVLKLTGDPAFERLRARGAVAGDVDSFQRAEGGPSSRALRWLRDWGVRRARHVFTPSAYLRDLVIGWGADPARVSVMRNPVPDLRASAARSELRTRFGMEGDTLAFAGRLTAQKSLEVLLEALVACPGVNAVLAGDGEQAGAVAAAVERLGLRDRVRLLGPLPRQEVVDLFAAADASVLSSSWENFPHGVVESLAVGTPVISTRAGGVAEVVEDGLNGLLVDVGDVEGLAAAIRRYLGDDDLRGRLRASARASVEPYRAERLLGALLEQLEAVRS